jgi:hypothetical protein
MGTLMRFIGRMLCRLGIHARDPEPILSGVTHAYPIYDAHMETEICPRCGRIRRRMVEHIV